MKFKYPKGENYKVMMELFRTRNAEILSMFKRGMGYEEISNDKRFGLTRQRVYQIVRDELKKEQGSSKGLDKKKKRVYTGK